MEVFFYDVGCSGPWASVLMSFAFCCRRGGLLLSCHWGLVFSVEGAHLVGDAWHGRVFGRGFRGMASRSPRGCDGCTTLAYPG